MNETALNTATSRALWDAVRGAFTGRLSLPSSPDGLCVMLMRGEIIGAEAPNDVPSLLGRLAREGHLFGKFARELLERSQRGDYILDALAEPLGQEYLDHILHERFRENLRHFVGAAEVPLVREDAALFPVNMQFGLNTAEVVRAAVEDWQLAQSLDVHAEVIAGSTPPQGELEVRLAMLAADPISLSELLPFAYMEPIASRALVARLIRCSKLAFVVEEIAPEQLESLEEAAPDDLEVLPDPTAEVDLPEVEWVSAATAQVEPLDGGDEDAGSEDELDAFADYDENRADGGTFLTDDHNLDRVEVHAVVEPPVQRFTVTVPEEDDEEEEPLVDARPAVEEDEPEVIEADESPRASFGAPTLGDDEALEKVIVANEVLSSFVGAFDSAHGSGAGRAHLQILVDGCPSKFKDLFRDVPVQDDGGLSRRVLMRNLNLRPASEHRRWLNEALVDLIERALSMAADDLPEEDFDAMYEAVAGYRQRLGL